MRCPDCQKFVAYDTDQEPEIDEDPNIHEGRHFTAAFMRRLACAECGTDLKEGRVDVEGEIDGKPCATADTHNWEVTSCEASPMSSRKGYGVLCVVAAKCANCGIEKTDIEFEGVLAAGAFEELV